MKRDTVLRVGAGALALLAALGVTSAALAAQSKMPLPVLAGPTTMTPAGTWVTPFFQDGVSPNEYTFLPILNTGSASDTVTVTFYSKTGSKIADISRSVAAGEAWQLFTATAGGVGATRGGDGWLKIQGLGTSLVPSGFVVLPNSGNFFGLSLPFYTVAATPTPTPAPTATPTPTLPYVLVHQWGARGGAPGQFDYPIGIAVDAAGNVYVSEQWNHRIQKFNLGGTFFTLWGGNGGAPGQMDAPWGVATDNAGNFYVADSGNHRMQKFTSAGVFIKTWGSLGSGDGQFNQPTGVAVDSGGNVYVAELGNHRIQKFDSNGTFLATWGTWGFGPGELNGPRGVAVDSTGGVYVADTGNDRVQRFTSNGVLVAQWNGSGTPAGGFYRPWGIATDSADNVYVADSGNTRVAKFTSSGAYLNHWDSSVGLGTPVALAVDGAGYVYVADYSSHQIQVFAPTPIPPPAASPLPTPPTLYGFLTKWGVSGVSPGQFRYPLGVALDGAGNVYVTDLDNHRVQKFNANGAFIMEWGGSGCGPGQFGYPWGIAINGAGDVYVVDFSCARVQKFSSTGVFQAQWGSYGSGDGQFNNPAGVTVDTAGSVYVADFGNHRIQKFDSNGNFLVKWGSKGGGPGQFESPRGVAMDGAGNVYVADTGNHRVQKFAPDGTFITSWGGGGLSAGNMYHPWAIAVGGGGNVFVADTDNLRVQKFTSWGAYLTQFGSEGSGDGQFNGLVALAVNGAGNVYVVEELNHRIEVFGPATPAPPGGFAVSVCVSGVDRPHGLVFAPDGSLYIADLGTSPNRVLRSNPACGATSSFPVPNNLGAQNAWGLALSPGGGTLFISDASADAPEDAEILKSSPPGAEPLLLAGGLGSPLIDPIGMVLAPAGFGALGGKLIVADDAGYYGGLPAQGLVFTVDPDTGAVSSVTPPGRTILRVPFDVAFTPDGMLFVADPLVGVAQVTPNGAVSLLAPVEANAVVAHPITGELFATTWAHTIVRINPATGQVTTFASGFSDFKGQGSGVGGIEFNLDGTCLYVSDSGVDTVLRICGAFGPAPTPTPTPTPTMTPTPTSTATATPTPMATPTPPPTPTCPPNAAPCVLEGTTFAVEPTATSGKVRLVLGVTQALDANNQPTALPGGVRRVRGIFLYDPGCMELLNVQGSGPFTQVVWNDSSGTVTVTADLASNATSLQPPFEWLRLWLRLKGSARVACTFQATAPTEYLSGATPPAQSWFAARLLDVPFLRGDANGSGSVTLADGVTILQYLVGIRTLDQINPLNAASVSPDIPASPPDTGDRISLADAVQVLRYLVGLVGEFFQ